MYSRKHGSVGVISRFFDNLQTHATFSGVGCGHGHIDSKQMVENLMCCLYSVRKCSREAHTKVFKFSKVTSPHKSAR